MHRTLIVARLRPGASREVAEVFAESDRTELPELVGVTSRSLFSFHDLYFHLFETSDDPAPVLDRVREHPLFADVSAKLSGHVVPYDPGWRGPRDAMAQEFYRWPAR